MKTVRTCTRCVMDDSVDPTITFDEEGRCSYCTRALESAPYIYFPNAEGEKRLRDMLAEVRDAAAGKPYDCIMGISGGLDSSYLACLGAARWGLRILAVHIDDGFDTAIAADNIRKLCAAANVTLEVVKPDAAQFNDLTRSFIRAGVPNIAIPQDNILVACLHEAAKKYGIKYFLSGGNFALECVLEQGNTYDAFDTAHIRDIHRRFGEGPIDRLPMITLFQKGVTDRFIHSVKALRPLNYIDYNRERAIGELADFCGFQYYGSKHLENTLTLFTQLYWFYNKFGVDKRKSHLSSMIVSGQMAREEALRILAEPLYDEDAMRKVIDGVLAAIGMGRDEFSRIMSDPPRKHTDYRTSGMERIGRSYFAVRRMIRKK